MNANTKLLHEIYYEAITAIAIISSILENQPDGKFFDILFGRMTEYRKIANETIMLLGDNQIQIKPQPVSDKFSLITMRKMAKTIKSKAVIKGLIIRGSVEGIKSVLKQVSHLVVVTNEIFSESCSYEGETEQYQQYLGEINQAMAEMADEVVEVVYGIPLYHKQGVRRNEKYVE